MVVSVASLSVTTGREDPDDRTDTEEPLLEAGADAVPVERVRAGPAVPGARLELAEWPDVLPELPAECGAAPESDDPPSVAAAATP